MLIRLGSAVRLFAGNDERSWFHFFGIVFAMRHIHESWARFRSGTQRTDIQKLQSAGREVGADH
jgi:hypothetical protein